jgi:hypothetical protein
MTFVSAAEEKLSCSEQFKHIQNETERNAEIYECEAKKQAKTNRTAQTVAVIGSAVGTAGSAVSTIVSGVVIAKINDVIKNINECRGSF